MPYAEFAPEDLLGPPKSARSRSYGPWVLFPDVERIVDPCVGKIWYEGGEAKREP